jgi:SAM-dependent methyltransferase
MDENDPRFWNDVYNTEPDQDNVEDRVLNQEVTGLPVGKALDLGCGTGRNILKLAKEGWSVVGVDWAERAIEIAERSAQKMGIDANFIVADFTTWQPTAQFDLVFTSYSLMGLEGARRTLQTASKALVEGGTLLVVEWDKSMREVWGFEEGILLSPGEIADLLPEFLIEKAEVRRFEGLFTDEDQRQTYGSWVNVAVVRARKLKCPG